MIIRKDNTLPFELALGFGSAIAGLSAFVLFPTALLINFESALNISSTGLIILLSSFYFLSNASRFTSATNVSILMHLETVLGPLWVWLGVGETPGLLGFVGGAIVVAAVFYFLVGPKAAPLHPSSKLSPPAN